MCPRALRMGRGSMGDYNNLAADQHQMRGAISLSDVLKMCSSARVSLPHKGKEK
jgi:hypothetical protein